MSQARQVMTLEQLLTTRSVVSPDDLALCGFPASRMTIYAWCRAHLHGEKDGIECTRLGRKIVIPTAPLRVKFHIASAQGC
jgi:hypothetical protein